MSKFSTFDDFEFFSSELSRLSQRSRPRWDEKREEQVNKKLKVINQLTMKKLHLFGTATEMNNWWSSTTKNNESSSNRDESSEWKEGEVNEEGGGVENVE